MNAQMGLVIDEALKDTILASASHLALNCDPDL